MCRALLYILVGLIALCNTVFGEIIDILNREHWDDLTSRTDGSAMMWKDTVLLMYGGEGCSYNEAKQETGFTDQGLPSKEHLVIGHHDYVTQAEASWYDWIDDFDIAGTHNVTQCPTILYRKADTPDTTSEKWDPEKDGSFVEWVKNKLKVKVTFVNNFDGEVQIEARCPDPSKHSISQKFEETESEDEASPPGKLEVELMPECIAVITAQSQEEESDENIFLGAWDIITSMEIQIPSQESEKNEERVLVDIGKRRSSVSVWMRDFVWNHTRRHLKILKQALILPLFTIQGYEKFKMPDELYDLLRNFYQDNKHRAVAESWPEQNFQINQHEIPLSMVTLSPYVINRTDAILRPMIREWIGGEWVEFRTLYGLREYYQGSVLKTHLDRVETHSLGTILNVAQDMSGCDGDCPPWELEMINRYGEKHFVPMKPGEMVFYEPGTVPHGRPKPLQGHLYVNAFCHWIVDDWDFKLERNAITDHVKDRKVLLQPITDHIDIIKADFERRKAEILDGSPRIIPKVPPKPEEPTMESIQTPSSKWRLKDAPVIIVSGRKGFNREINGKFDKLGEMDGRSFYKRRVKVEYGIAPKPIYLYHFQGKWRFRGSPQINDSSMAYVTSEAKKVSDSGSWEHWRIWDGDKWVIDENIEIAEEVPKPKVEAVQEQIKTHTHTEL